MNARDALPFPDAPATIVGAPAVVRGETNTWSLGLPPPTALTARSRTVYVEPLFSPAMTSGDACDTGERMVQVTPSSTEYSYVLMAVPPSDTGAVNATEAPASRGVAVRFVGAPGVARSSALE